MATGFPFFFAGMKFLSVSLRGHGFPAGHKWPEQYWEIPLQYFDRYVCHFSIVFLKDISSLYNYRSLKRIVMIIFSGRNSDVEE